MNHIHMKGACETPLCGGQDVHARSQACRGGAVSGPIQHLGGSPERILLVDDDRNIRELCADALISAGHLVDTAEDGAAGWLALQGKNYSLLITDNNMPKVSGIELVKQLRAAHMDLPVLLASSAIPTEAIGRDPSLELAATLLKPFTIFELLDTVETILKANGCRKVVTKPINGVKVVLKEPELDKAA